MSAGILITEVQVTAANTVMVTFAATQALMLASGSQSLNFTWTR